MPYKEFFIPASTIFDQCLIGNSDFEVMEVMLNITGVKLAVFIFVNKHTFWSNYK